MINFFLYLKIFFDPFDRIPTSKTWCPAAGAQSEPARTTPTSLPAPNSVRGGEPAARPSGRPRPCSLPLSGAGPRSPPSFPRSLCDRKTQDFTYKHNFSMRCSTFTEGGMGVLICSSLSSQPKYCCMPCRYLLQRTSYIRVGYTLSVFPQLKMGRPARFPAGSSFALAASLAPDLGCVYTTHTTFPPPSPPPAPLSINAGM